MFELATLVIGAYIIGILLATVIGTSIATWWREQERLKWEIELRKAEGLIEVTQGGSAELRQSDEVLFGEQA